MLDLIVRDGQAVLPHDTQQVDIGLKDGRIALIGDLRDQRATRVIDASGHLVLPGLVDPHVHIADVADVTRTRALDDFYTGTVAAALGGTTTVIDFAYPAKGQSLQEAIRNRREEADGKVVIDYSLHAVVNSKGESALASMGGLKDLGISSIKVYVHRGDMTDDHALFHVLQRARDLDLLVMVHAESESLLEGALAELLEAGHLAARYFPASRPPITEIEATARVVFLSELAGNKLYVVHVAAEKALDPIRRARSRGQNVWAETTSHYLTLTDEVYAGDDGVNYVCSPPIREQTDQDALWRGLIDDDLQTVCSDHCGATAEQKAKSADDFRWIEPGLAGIQTHGMVVFSEGVSQGRISLERFVQVMSTNPARLFGLYPRKGALAPGSDGDLIIIDPNATWTVEVEQMYVEWGYSPNSGQRVVGRPVAVIQAGRVIVEDGEFKGTRGSGRYLARQATIPPID